LYETNANFVEAWTARKSHDWRPNSISTLLHPRRISFQKSTLVDPRESIRENLIRALHNGGFSGHFKMDKTQVLVEENYY
jgi:hypothetical protein